MAQKGMLLLRALLLRALLLAAAVGCSQAGSGKDRDPLELCSLTQFKRAMDYMLDTPDLLSWPDKGQLLQRYKDTVKTQKCATVPSAKWPLSKVKGTMIINVGEGSTGTRFLNCVMRRLGLNGAHTRGDKDMTTGKAKNRTKEIEFLGCEHYSSCTDGWDQFSYISDSPVPYYTAELLATHPHAFVIQSLRAPAAWQKSRIGKHIKQGAEKWHQATVCGDADHPMKHPLTDLDYVLYNIFSRCISPQDGRSLVFNLFKESSVSILTRLLDFLAGNNVTLTPHIPASVVGATAIATHVETVCKAEASGKFKKGPVDAEGNIKAFRSKGHGVKKILGNAAERLCSQERMQKKVGNSCQFFLAGLGFGRG